MSRPHRGRFETWLRGGQTAHHTFDMTLEIVGWLSFIGAGWFLVCAYLLWNSNAATRAAGGLTLWAWFCQTFGNPFPQVMNIKPIDAPSVAVPVKAIWQVAEVAGPARIFWAHAIQWGLFFLGGCILIAIGASWVFSHVGRDKVKTRQIRGQEITPLSDLMRQIYAFNAEVVKERHEARIQALEEAHKSEPNAAPFDRKSAAEATYVPFVAPALAGVPYPIDSETQHTMVVGAPGSGKTEAIHQLIDTIREKGQRAIIFDPELDFIRAHYQDGLDVILNPFDARSPGWSPFDDALDRPDWDKLGRAIFKDPKSGDPYWVEVARSLFSWTGYALRRRNPNIELTEALDLLFGPTKKLKALLEGTPAAKHLNGIEGSRVSSLESVLTNGVEPLIYLYGSKQRFSIQEWTNREAEDGGFLFLSTPESHMDSIRPLLGFWSEIAIGAMLSRHEIARHPTWLILDEFHSAGKIEKLADGPQRLRKYGGAVVLGFQQVSQLQDLYGPDKAKTIVGQCQTKLILRAGDRDTAEVMSEQIGRRVMRRVEENTSYGANSIRDGVGLTPKEELEPILLPEDVFNLPALEGIIRVSNVRRSGPFPIAPIKIAYVERDKRTPGFVAKPTDPVDDYLNRLRRRFDQRDDGSKPDGSDGPVRPDGQGPRPSPRAVIGIVPSADEAPSKETEKRPADGLRSPAKKPAFAALTGLARSNGAADRADAAAAAGSGQDAGGLSPALEIVPTQGAGEEDDDAADRERELVARPVDLPTVQAELLRRREEEDEAVRVQKTHADRRHDASEPARLSVFQKEGEILREPDEGGGLEIGENVTTGEIHFAETHRHEAIGAALGLAVSGVMGVSGDMQAGARHRRSDIGGDSSDDGDDRQETEREATRDAALPDLGRPIVAEQPAVDLLLDVAPPDREARSEVQLSGQSAAARIKRQMAAEMAVTSKIALGSDPEREPDPDRDRDMEMTR